MDTNGKPEQRTPREACDPVDPWRRLTRQPRPYADERRAREALDDLATNPKPVEINIEEASELIWCEHG